MSQNDVKIKMADVNAKYIKVYLSASICAQEKEYRVSSLVTGQLSGITKLTAISSPITIIWKLPFCISPCSETPPVK